MKFNTLDDLINAVDSVVRVEIDVEESTFDCDMQGTIQHADGRQSHFYLHEGGWRILGNIDEQPTLQEQAVAELLRSKGATAC